MASHSRPFVAASLFVLASCASTTTASLSDAELARAAAARQSLDDVAAALRLADLGPLAVPVPRAPSELRPDQPEFWHAAALAWNPELRQLRRRVRELRAEQGSAGAPGSVELLAQTRDAGDLELESELALTIDVLGVLGLGPAAAARELARERSRAAFGEFEAAVWKLRFDVDRARVRLARAKALAASMDALYGECAEDELRVRKLAERGWIGSGMQSGYDAALHMIEHRRAMAAADASEAKADLAELCGLDAAHAAFDELAGGVIARFRPEELELRDPGREELLARLPELRARRLELAMAEAELRAEARERWPMLRFGPRLTLMPGDSLLGGMLGIDVPFPGAVEGRIAAAHERREAAREALEDALVNASSNVTTARERLETLLEQFEEHAPEFDAEVARMLVAAQAGFRIDGMTIDKLALAIRERVESLTSLAQARADAVIASLDYDEARGVAAEVQP